MQSYLLKALLITDRIILDLGTEPKNMDSHCSAFHYALFLIEDVWNCITRIRAIDLTRLNKIFVLGFSEEWDAKTWYYMHALIWVASANMIQSTSYTNPVVLCRSSCITCLYYSNGEGRFRVSDILFYKKWRT